MNKETLKYVIAQFVERDLPAVRPRELELPLSGAKVVSLIGVRRSGKTFLMFHTMRRLMAQGVNRRQIIYLNFEDDRLYPVGFNELDLILTAHGELYPETLTQRRYLFLDEVHAVPAWEKYVRRVYDTEKIALFVTGSSSRLMISDLAPALRGRGLTFEVFPLNFREYAAFKGLKTRPYNRADEMRIVHALEEYVRWGGLPEIVMAEKSLRPLIMEEYTSLIFFRDLVERYGVRNERVMRMLLKYCCSQPAGLISAHKLHADFRSQGYALSKNTIYEYLDYLQDAFVLFVVPKHDYSLRKQEQNPKKVHLIDVGLVQAFSGQPDSDLGHKLENVVFLHERRQHKRIFYYKNTNEVDVYIEDRGHPRFINVAWSMMRSETYKRESDAMRFGQQHYPNARGMLIVHELPPLPLKGCAVVPAWRYLLGQ